MFTTLIGTLLIILFGAHAEHYLVFSKKDLRKSVENRTTRSEAYYLSEELEKTFKKREKELVKLREMFEDAHVDHAAGLETYTAITDEMERVHNEQQKEILLAHFALKEKLTKEEWDKLIALSTEDTHNEK